MPAAPTLRMRTKTTPMPTTTQPVLHLSADPFGSGEETRRIDLAQLDRYLVLARRSSTLAAVSSPDDAGGGDDEDELETRTTLPHPVVRIEPARPSCPVYPVYPVRRRGPRAVAGILILLAASAAITALCFV